MPTGGITLDNVSDYLSLSNVCAVGGSWLSPRSLIEDQRWEEIVQLARNTAATSLAMTESAI